MERAYNPFDDIDVNKDYRVRPQADQEPAEVGPKPLPPGNVYEHFTQKPASTNPFDAIHVDEPWYKNMLRTAIQWPKARMEVKAWKPMAILKTLQLAGLGEALDPEDLDRLEEIHRREGIPFDREQYMQGVRQAYETFPTFGNIERGIEKQTGLPLEAKTRPQRALGLAGGIRQALGPTGAGATALQAAGAGGAAVAGSEAMQKFLGVPETAADVIASLGIGRVQPGQVKPIVTIGPKEKPSGLTERMFERTEKPTSVSKSRLEKLDQKVETEFRDLSNKIKQTSENKTVFEALDAGPEFKETAREAFNVVAQAAEDIKQPISGKELKTQIIRQVAEKKGRTILTSEFEQHKRAYLEKLWKSTTEGNMSVSDLVKQYRENNAGWGELWEPGQSSAYNRAKQAALSEYNKAIVETLRKQGADPTFVGLFEDTNKAWQQIMDAESLNRVIDEIATGKIDFARGEKFLDQHGIRKQVERSLGKDGAKQFDQLVKDVVSMKTPRKFLRERPQKDGMAYMAKRFAHFMFFPKSGAALGAYEMAKGAYTALWEALLDKPKLAVKWNKGVNAAKAGDVKAAEKMFRAVEAEVLPPETIKQLEASATKPTTVDITTEPKAPPPKPSPKKEPKTKAAEPKSSMLPAKRTATEAAKPSATKPSGRYLTTDKGTVPQITHKPQIVEKKPPTVMSPKEVVKTVERASPRAEPSEAMPTLKYSDSWDDVNTALTNLYQSGLRTAEEISSIEKRIYEMLDQAGASRDLYSPVDVSVPISKPLAKEDIGNTSAFVADRMLDDMEGAYTPTADRLLYDIIRNRARTGQPVSEEKLYRTLWTDAKGDEEVVKQALVEMRKAVNKANAIANELPFGTKAQRKRGIRPGQAGYKPSPKVWTLAQVRELMGVKKAKPSKVEKKATVGTTQVPKKAKVVTEDVRPSHAKDLSPKTLKKQKDFFEKAIEDAIKNPIDDPWLVVKVPDDGVFKIRSDSISLQKALDKVKKHWPTSKLQTKAPSHRNVKGKGDLALAKRIEQADEIEWGLRQHYNKSQYGQAQTWTISLEGHQPVRFKADRALLYSLMKDAEEKFPKQKGVWWGVFKENAPKASIEGKTIEFTNVE